MKKLLSSLLISSALIAVIYAAVIRVSEFGGLNTDDNPLFLVKQTPDAENMVTDEGEGLQPRSGFIEFSTEASRNLYSFYTANGNKYLITQSSNVLKATLGGAIFDIYISTVDPNVITSISGLGDKLFFGNTTDGLKSWDTSSIAVIGTFKPKYLATHKGRLWMAGVAGDERNIYASEYLDGTNFTLATDPVDTDPTRLSVQGALDDILTGLYASFDDKLMWYKQRSFGGILGTRRSNFQSREYSNTVGCAYPDSIKNCNGLLRWLGNDRIIYEFDGEKYYPINEDIDAFMDTIEQGDLNLRQWVQTSAADWNAGTIGVGLDTTTVSGDIGLRSGGTTQISVFLATGTLRSGGSTDSTYVNASTAMRGAFALMFIATDTAPLDKVTMSFAYKSTATEGFQSWVTLHTGATYPAAVVLDTATNRVQGDTNATGVLTKITTDYYFAQSATEDKRLTRGTTYWLVMHTTVTSFNTTPSLSVFNYIGAAQTWIVPPGVSSMTIDLYGAAGATPGAGSGPQKGGFIHSSMSVTPGETLYAYVGGEGSLSGGGFNGGGGLLGNLGGGGATDLRRNGNSLSDRVLIAAGAGGGGFHNGNGYADTNIGAYLFGGSAIEHPLGSCSGGGGATISTGGAGGNCNIDGGAGSLGQGGTPPSGGGGGGGGYYGGGSGGRIDGSGPNNSGGGGGSGWSAYGTPAFLDGVRFGNGMSSFTYIGHAEFYVPEIESPNLSSTTLLYTSSFTFAGSNYRTGTYDGEFQVYFATLTMNSTFTTRVFDAGTKFNEWGAVGLDDTAAGGSITYTIFTDTDNVINIYNSSTFIGSQVVTDGQTPTIQIERYIAVSGAFARLQTFATHTAILHSITLNFSEGSSIRTFSEFIENRYWLGVALSSSSNNRVLVYDTNKQWHRYSGINISAIGNYSGTFYFGNSNGIFQAEYGTDDNGTAITAYYRTKTYAASGIDTYTTFLDLFLTTINSAATVQTEYYVDEHSTAISMPSYAMNTKSGYQNFRLPFSVSGLKQGKYISFKWTISSIYTWRLLNANLYFMNDPEPQE